MNMKSKLFGLLVGVAFLGVETASATSITYDFSDTVGSLSVSGAITTDGTPGVLSPSNISSWQYTITGDGSPITASGNSNLQLSGAVLTASGNNLLFNFSDTGGNSFVFGTNPTDVRWESSISGIEPGLFQIYVPGNIQTAVFSGDLVIASVPVPSATPLPAALPLFATGLGVMGWLAKRRKRTNAATLAAA